MKKWNETGSGPGAALFLAFPALLTACRNTEEVSLTQTIEVLQSGAFESGGVALASEDLSEFLASCEGYEELSRAPLRIVAPKEARLADVYPVLAAAYSADVRRSDITLAISGAIEASYCTLPVPFGHGCGALVFFNGAFKYDDHGENPSYVFAHLGLSSNGALLVEALEYQASDSQHPVDLESALITVQGTSPPVGQPVAPDVLAAWFERLTKDGFRPIAKVDWDLANSVEDLVNLLHATEEAIGPRVIFPERVVKEEEVLDDEGSLDVFD